MFEGKYEIEPRVPDLNIACTNRCEEIQFECIINCGDDSACISACVREIAQCFNGKSHLLSH